MEETLYVIETSKKTYLSIEQVGAYELEIRERAKPYHGNLFEEESEANKLSSMIENGDPNWNFYVDTSLFPLTVNKIIFKMEA